MEDDHLRHSICDGKRIYKLTTTFHIRADAAAIANAIRISDFKSRVLMAGRQGHATRRYLYVLDLDSAEAAYTAFGHRDPPWFRRPMWLRRRWKASRIATDHRASGRFQALVRISVERLQDVPTPQAHLTSILRAP